MVRTTLLKGAVKIKVHSSLVCCLRGKINGHWHIPLKVHLMLGFRHKCTYSRSKPNVEIKMMSPYHSMQMSTQRRIQLRCMCLQQTVPNRHIKVKFGVGYFQW